MLTLTMLAALCFGFASCDDDDDDDGIYKGNPIVGTWVDEYPEETNTYTFNADGTYEEQAEGNGFKRYKMRKSGTFRLAKNLLTLTEGDKRWSYDFDSGKWNEGKNPYGGETYSFNVSIDSRHMYFYDDEDTEMRNLWWTYIKK